MIIFKTSDLVSSNILQHKKSGKKIGFVPTMGALHEGHLSLIEVSKMSNDITICSIFVNPTQFNNAEDFKLYPVTIDKDIDKLIGAGCDVLFLPSVNEMYPPGYVKKHYELGEIETVFEGKYRPGHFQGVCQAVDRLLEIVQPDNLYMGQKDFQQCMVIKKLLQLLHKEDDVKLNVIPTSRESDGLAMSSRNLRLNKTQRALAPSIYNELSEIRKQLRSESPDVLADAANRQLSKMGFKVDYVAIANADDLSTPANSSASLVALAAASIGGVRLIDNLMLNN